MVSVFGIRHHGPGSARSLLQALERLRPDVILLEGPPDAENIIQFAADTDMQPPVAMLVYDRDNPAYAAYYPFAEFSPEWQTIRYAVTNNVPIRFMDLPMAHQFGIAAAQSEVLEATSSGESADDVDEPTDPQAETVETSQDIDCEAETLANDPSEGEERLIRRDPLNYLAQAAGFEDGEGWWEYQVENRAEEDADLFTGIAEAMTALREELGDHPGAQNEDLLREQMREAYMRRVLRNATKESFDSIAVVCGAWHVPALLNHPKVKDDNAILKALPKARIESTWIPWTYGRLSIASGYGAGVASPGWYHHLWNAGAANPAHWLTLVARCFRDEGMDVSSAHVIETVRLAETLAAMRHLPLAGLDELNEAIRTVMLFGDEMPMRLIRERLTIGERLGQTPDSVPAAPLQRDLNDQQRRLRFKPTAEDKEVVLDLRKPNDLARSCLLHRLNLLGIEWGKESYSSGKGTFKEAWRVKWQPEFAVRLIECGRWGRTVEQAAAAIAVDEAQHASLAALTTLAQSVIVADLPTAVDAVMQRLEAEAALATDVALLMDALPHLAKLFRYGDVRGSRVEIVESVIHTIVPRICIGLGNACVSLNDDAATEMAQHLRSANDALQLIELESFYVDWYAALTSLCQRDSINGRLRGRSCRLLLDAEQLDAEWAVTIVSLALSRAVEPDQAAGWLEGFLEGSGQILVYDDQLWRLVDRWVAELSPDAFVQVLPLIRRTFSTFTPPERRQMGERVRHHPLGSAVAPMVPETFEDFDRDRADTVLPVLCKYLGLSGRSA